VISIAILGVVPLYEDEAGKKITNTMEETLL